MGAAIFGAVEYTRIRLGAGSTSNTRRRRRSCGSRQRCRRPAKRGLSVCAVLAAGFGRALTCLCSRVALTDGTTAVLLAATEPAGPSLPLRERVRRLFAGREQTLAAFTADGRCSMPPRRRARGSAAHRRCRRSASPALPRKALAAGSAGGTTPYGAVTVERLGRDASAVLVVQFDAQPRRSSGGANAPRKRNRRRAAGGNSYGGRRGDSAASRFRPGRDEGAAERRHPLRFVWQMDADGRFVVGSDEFIELMGPRTTAAFGRLWSEIAAELKLDPENQIARAVATRETWSGVTVSWPVDDGDERLPVELSGLPVFDRDREFRGYRGFGVCRDLDRINHLARARRERPIGFMTPPEARAASEGASAATPPLEAPAETAAATAPAPSAAETKTEDGACGADRPALNVVPAAANVVPFRAGAAPEPKAPTLSPVERKAFRELAQELTARLHGVREDLAEANRADVLPAGGEADAAETRGGA